MLSGMSATESASAQNSAESVASAHQQQNLGQELAQSTNARTDPNDQVDQIAALEAARTVSLRNLDREPNPALALPDDGSDNRSRMLAGQWYIANHPVSRQLNKDAGAAAVAFSQQYVTDQEGAQKTLAAALGSFGERSWVRPPFAMDYGDNIHIGDDVFINFGMTALDVVEIRIGSHCQIGPNVQLLTAVHPIPGAPRAALLEAGDPIHIEENVWIGGGAIICPGVRVGRNAVIGAGSVVTKDVPDNSVVVGNPARIIKVIES